MEEEDEEDDDSMEEDDEEEDAEDTTDDEEEEEVLARPAPRPRGPSSGSQRHRVRPSQQVTNSAIDS